MQNFLFLTREANAALGVLGHCLAPNSAANLSLGLICKPKHFWLHDCLQFPPSLYAASCFLSRESQFLDFLFPQPLVFWMLCFCSLAHISHTLHTPNLDKQPAFLQGFVKAEAFCCAAV